MSEATGLAEETRHLSAAATTENQLQQTKKEYVEGSHKTHLSGIKYRQFNTCRLKTFKIDDL